MFLSSCVVTIKVLTYSLTFKFQTFGGATSMGNVAVDIYLNTLVCLKILLYSSLEYKNHKRWDNRNCYSMNKSLVDSFGCCELAFRRLGSLQISNLLLRTFKHLHSIEKVLYLPRRSNLRNLSFQTVIPSNDISQQKANNTNVPMIENCWNFHHILHTETIRIAVVENLKLDLVTWT